MRSTDHFSRASGITVSKEAWISLQDLFFRFAPELTVRVAKSRDNNLPGLVPRLVLFVDENALKLDDRKRRVSVVELNRVEVAERRPR